MNQITIKLCLVFLLSTFYLYAISLDSGLAQQASLSHPQQRVPRMWVDEEMNALEIPLADPASSPHHVSADYYYRIPVRPIYKSYPVYAPGKEPLGYLDKLKTYEPETAFDPAKLETEEDWIHAGELAFDAPIFFWPLDLFKVRDPEWNKAVGMPQTQDGTIPFFRYVIREKGRVELGVFSCGMCHTRVMPDGSLIKGAQGNFPFDRAWGTFLKTQPTEQARRSEARLFAVHWLKADDPRVRIDQMSAEELGNVHLAIPPGVLARHRTSLFQPVQVPDLIGVKDRKYLDRTGLQLQHSVVDMMRYGALNQGADDLASFAGFIPRGNDFKTLPDPAKLTRYSDEQLYALSLYIYSLKPPANPHKYDALAARGQQVFTREGCAACHTPPLYTNNKLTVAEGFTVPEEHRHRYDILPISVGTDPTLALKTRRGTGYYKVPSLRGVWYRGPFEHSGSVASLEDWFDPGRLRDDYEPTGWRSFGVKTRAIRGHEFGLQLSEAERRALIAFLRTL